MKPPVETEQGEEPVQKSNGNVKGNGNVNGHAKNEEPPEILEVPEGLDREPTTDDKSSKGSSTAKGGKRKKISLRDNATFSWRDVGGWDASATDNEVKSEVTKLLKQIEYYVVDHFYGDLYWNTSLMFGTCFFAWLVARLGGGFLSLGLVLLVTNSVYRVEFRRFNRNVRDDMQRVAASNRLETSLESMEWMNSFLAKFWVIYMPALSEQVIYIANEVLKDQAPGFGIEKLSLDEFTLGTKAPRVDSVQSFTKKGQDHIEMIWKFSFAPNDTDDMTKNEIKRKIDPKVALGVTVGKAFISKSMPILVEDMSLKGRMRVTLKLTDTFPHVKLVSIQFLEAPQIDYKLKPVGGDTLGIDVMSFIPGLSSLVKSIIHANLGPMLYAPNSLDIDVEDMVAQQSNDSNGILAVTIKRMTNLKVSSEDASKKLTINPYLELNLLNNTNEDATQRTFIKKDTDNPVFLETKFLLVNQLENNFLKLSAYNLLPDKKDDEIIGATDFGLETLLQNPTHTGLTKSLIEGGKTVGKVEMDVRYYPAVPPLILDDGTKEIVTDSEIGIMKITLHEARKLDTSRSSYGLLNPYALIVVNGVVVKQCRMLRKTNEPSWDQTIEAFVTRQSETFVEIVIKDAAEDIRVGELNSNLQDLIFETSRGQKWFKCPKESEHGENPEIRVTATWKSLPMMNDGVIDTPFQLPIGGLRLHLRDATDLINLESVGEVDPYVRVLIDGKLVGKTAILDNTVNPIFNSVLFLPVSNENQHVLLEIMDQEVETKDRSLGTAAVHVNDFLKRNKEGFLLGYDGSDKVLEQEISYQGKSKGVLKYSVSFIPTIPVMSQSELDILKDKAVLERTRKMKELREKEDNEELMRKFPDTYELVEVDDAKIVSTSDKVHMPLEKALQYNAGAMVVHILGGHLSRPGLLIHTIFDDHTQPAGLSPRNLTKDVSSPSFAKAFIRDLQYSKLIFRLSDKMDVTHTKQVVAEREFKTINLLKESYDKPITVKMDKGNSIQIRLEFAPTPAKLAPLDTVLDVGIVKLEVISAENLKAVDSNGKSDPLATIKVDGVEVLRTDKKRKNLNPTWNESAVFPLLSRSRDIVLLEVCDWDLTHDEELLGSANLDLTSLPPNQPTEFKVNLNTQGTVNLRATFQPQYIRPLLNNKSGLPLDLKGVAGKPLELAGAVGGVGAAGVGAVGEVATGGLEVAGNAAKSGVEAVGSAVDKVGSAFKFGRSKKSKSNDDNDTSSESSGALESKAAVAAIAAPAIAADTTTSEKSSVHTGSPSKSTADVTTDSSYLPPPPKSRIGQLRSSGDYVRGHSRSSSSQTDASSIAPSINGSDPIPGRITIILAKGFDASSIFVKTHLKTSSREKEISKTRTAKKNKEDGSYSWSESCPFRSTSSGELLITVKEHHTLGKDHELGTATIQLTEIAGRIDDLQLPIGDGELLVNVRYGA